MRHAKVVACHRFRCFPRKGAKWMGHGVNSSLPGPKCEGPFGLAQGRLWAPADFG